MASGTRTGGGSDGSWGDGGGGGDRHVGLGRSSCGCSYAVASEGSGWVFVGRRSCGGGRFSGFRAGHGGRGDARLCILAPAGGRSCGAGGRGADGEMGAWRCRRLVRTGAPHDQQPEPARPTRLPPSAILGGPGYLRWIRAVLPRAPSCGHAGPISG